MPEKSETRQGKRRASNSTGNPITSQEHPMSSITDTQASSNSNSNPQRARTPRRRHRPIAGAPDLLPYPYTDTGNAERLVAMFGQLFRFSPDKLTEHRDQPLGVAGVRVRI